MIPDDLKDYKAPLGAFQIISPGDAFVVLVCLAVVCFIFSPYIK